MNFPDGRIYILISKCLPWDVIIKVSSFLHGSYTVCESSQDEVP